MNPTIIDHDYLMLRIGRLTVNLEAALVQRNAAEREKAEALAEADRLRARVAELEELVKLLGDDDDEDDDEEGAG